MTQRTCPECNAELELIQIVLRNPVGDHAGEMQYAAANARRSPWNGKYPTAGPVHALGCPECGRVLFFAERAVDRLPLPSTTIEADVSVLPLPSGPPA